MPVLLEITAWSSAYDSLTNSPENFMEDFTHFQKKPVFMT